MSEKIKKITGEQFGTIVTAAVDEMNQQWTAQIHRDPKLFPRSMTPHDWWMHFSTVSMPEKLLSGTKAKKIIALYALFELPRWCLNLAHAGPI